MILSSALDTLPKARYSIDDRFPISTETDSRSIPLLYPVTYFDVCEGSEGSVRQNSHRLDGSRADCPPDLSDFGQ